MHWAETSGTGATRSASGRAGSDGLRSSGGHTAANEARAAPRCVHCFQPGGADAGTCICPCWRLDLFAAAGWKEWTAIAAATDGGLRSAPAGSTHHLWLESSWRSRLPGTEHTARPPWTWRRARRCFAATRRRLARLRGLNICARRFWDARSFRAPPACAPRPCALLTRPRRAPACRRRPSWRSRSSRRCRQQLRPRWRSVLTTVARPPALARARARSARCENSQR
jgi:hypothetical protein